MRHVFFCLLIMMGLNGFAIDPATASQRENPSGVVATQTSLGGEYQTEQNGSGMSEEIFVMLVLVFLGLLLIGIFLGSTDRAVFYMNSDDVLLSFSPYIIMLVTMLLGTIVAEWWIGVGMILTVLVIIFITYKSFKYNKGVFVSLVMAYSKIILSATLCVQALKLLDKNLKGSGRILRQILLVSFLTGLTARLTNGDRVLGSQTSFNKA